MQNATNNHMGQATDLDQLSTSDGVFLSWGFAVSLLSEYHFKVSLKPAVSKGTSLVQEPFKVENTNPRVSSLSISLHMT